MSGVSGVSTFWSPERGRGGGGVKARSGIKSGLGHRARVSRSRQMLESRTYPQRRFRGGRSAAVPVPLPRTKLSQPTLQTMCLASLCPRGPLRASKPAPLLAHGRRSHPSHSRCVRLLGSQRRLWGCQVFSVQKRIGSEGQNGYGGWTLGHQNCVTGPNGRSLSSMGQADVRM